MTEYQIDLGPLQILRGLYEGKSMTDELSAWPERRPMRTEAERGEIANLHAAHLPSIPNNLAKPIHDADIQAMRAAFIRRFDEPLPRTETLMAVAMIGYRMALRDMLT